MQVFDFPYHRWEVKYPESSIRVQFGNNFTFTAKPDAPDLRVITLTFPSLKYYPPTIDGQGNATPDLSTNPKINLASLEDFYQTHRLHTTFIYRSPIYGDLKVRFNRPLEIPQGNVNGDGSVNDVKVELIEVHE